MLTLVARTGPPRSLLREGKPQSRGCLCLTVCPAKASKLLWAWRGKPSRPVPPQSMRGSSWASLLAHSQPQLTRSFTVSERSSHSGELNWYWPSMIIRNIRIWRRCQNGGEPARSVNKITPQAQLGKRSGEVGTR